MYVTCVTGSVVLCRILCLTSLIACPHLVAISRTLFCNHSTATHAHKMQSSTAKQYPRPRPHSTADQLTSSLLLYVMSWNILKTGSWGNPATCERTASAQPATQHDELRQAGWLDLSDPNYMSYLSGDKVTCGKVLLCLSLAFRRSAKSDAGPVPKNRASAACT